MSDFESRFTTYELETINDTVRILSRINASAYSTWPIQGTAYPYGMVHNALKEMIATEYGPEFTSRVIDCIASTGENFEYCEAVIAKELLSEALDR
jgi:hypothetical protein